ncbi:hypothetical protein, partial [Streptomyces sp. SP18BB07]|uniref:hypothetical protein n=1 Tax=Streptomyces sp. SP18BB07 TaxID=3002522 RepID=UPI002E7871DD
SDSCEVHFTDVVDEQNPSRPRYPEILAELVRRVEDSKLDIRLAAHWDAHGAGGGRRCRQQPHHTVVLVFRYRDGGRRGQDPVGLRSSRRSRPVRLGAALSGRP